MRDIVYEGITDLHNEEIADKLAFLKTRSPEFKVRKHFRVLGFLFLSLPFSRISLSEVQIATMT
jgi:hypothetical protein